MSEHDEQVALMDWINLYKREMPSLALIFAIPNQGGQGKGAIIRGQKMKREGLKKGVPDLFLPVAKGEYHGLFVEMKYEKGRPTDDQVRWLNALTEQGYCCGVCQSFEEAKDLIMDYMNLSLDGDDEDEVKFNYQFDRN